MNKCIKVPGDNRYIGKEMFNMDLVFNIMQRLLNEKRKTITTEEEESICNTIQACLDCRTYFYRYDYKVISGMFIFLGETDNQKISAYYHLIHLPQNEAKYKYRTIVSDK